MDEGYVYFIHAPSEGLVKIGYSAGHPDCRLKMLRIGSPVPLERLAFVRGGMASEREIHARFRHLRRHGEWFQFTDEIGELLRTEGTPWLTAVAPPREPKPKKEKPPKLKGKYEHCAVDHMGRTVVVLDYFQRLSDEKAAARAAREARKAARATV